MPAVGVSWIHGPPPFGGSPALAAPDKRHQYSEKIMGKNTVTVSRDFSEVTVNLGGGSALGKPSFRALGSLVLKGRERWEEMGKGVGQSSVRPGTLLC